MPDTPRKWTADTDTQLRHLHAQGMSLTKVAHELGFSPAWVSRKSAALGLSWDRTKTAKATDAKVEDARARRAELQLRALRRAEAIFDRLEGAQFQTILKGEYGSESERQLEFVPSRDERELATAASTHMSSAMRLDQHDSSAGAAQVVGLLQRTAEALGLNDATDIQP